MVEDNIGAGLEGFQEPPTKRQRENVKKTLMDLGFTEQVRHAQGAVRRSIHGTNGEICLLVNSAGPARRPRGTLEPYMGSM